MWRYKYIYIKYVQLPIQYYIDMSWLLELIAKFWWSFLRYSQLCRHAWNHLRFPKKCVYSGIANPCWLIGNLCTFSPFHSSDNFLHVLLILHNFSLRMYWTRSFPIHRWKCTERSVIAFTPLGYSIYMLSQKASKVFWAFLC